MADPRDAAAVWLWCQLTGTCAENAAQTELQRLSLEERMRADRFLFAHDRRDYVLAHALLRQLLAARHGGAAARWQVSADGRGKPFVLENPGLHVTLSHATGCVACAAADDHGVGVDVEPVSRWRDIQRVGLACLADSEREHLLRCADTERPTALVDLWTLKEATAKALGLGLAMPMHDVAFRLEGGAVECEAGVPAADARWHFAIFAPGAGYRVATVVRQHTAGAPTIAAQCLTPDGWRALRPVRTSSGYAIETGAWSATRRP